MQTCIRNNQTNPRQTASLEVLEERTPARLVFLGALADAKNLSKTLTIDADRPQQGDVAHFPGPTALEHDAVQKHVRMLGLDRAVPPPSIAP
jgi:hypothetical protein